MKQESKQTLITLSLAGSIGYYLYNKMIKAGLTRSESAVERIPAAERTAAELVHIPAPIVEPEVEEVVEKIEVMAEPEQIENVAEEKQVDESLESVVDEFDTPELDTPELDLPVLEEEGEITTEETATPDLNLDNMVLDTPELDLIPDDAKEDDTKDEDVKIPRLPGSEDDDAEDLFANSNDLMPEELLAADEEDDTDEDLSVDDLFAEVQKDEEKTEAVMDNVEALHKVDANDESAKKEFQSVMDFFNTL